MACYNPLHGWASRELTENGKRTLVLNPKLGYLDMPMSVPCGKCTGCRATKSMEWAVRCYHESTQHLQNSFVTLTYNDENYPKDGKINKKHLQNFFKKLRRRGYQFKYFGTGEYGETTKRAHYHVLFFGQSFNFDKKMLTEKLYTSETLEKIWGLGNISIGQLELSSIMYTVGYTQKKVTQEDTFNLMSKRPSIGKDWIEQYKDDIAKNGFLTIQGQKFKIPKYYLDQDEDLFYLTKLKNKEHGEKIKYTAEQLEQKELTHYKKINYEKESI